jgi:hypothetical protein
MGRRAAYVGEVENAYVMFAGSVGSLKGRPLEIHRH